ncbi:MAG: substrate-binding domain-containing protein [Isosphaeraceae bacterium]|nr:substrate-binding domain-containing protein [Isosphaeraceae bacterium]
MRTPCRYWSAAFREGVRLFPVEASPLGLVPHDGVYEAGSPLGHAGAEPERTLVLACCDPAVGLLAGALAQAAGVRLVVLPRSSRSALALLRQGLVHAAGVHLSPAGQPGGNLEAVKDDLGAGYALLRAAEWEEGITFSPARAMSTVRAAVHSELRWVGRERGSAARECLDELLGGRTLRRVASDHRGVAEAVRSGWADAGVCLRLVSEEAGLDFLPVRREVYDICLPDSWKGDDRLRALVSAVRSPAYRRVLGELPGYDSAATGEFEHVVLAGAP